MKKAVEAQSGIHQSHLPDAPSDHLPGGRVRHPLEFQNDPRTLGQHSADLVATYTGSWKFIFVYVALTVVWCIGNIIAWTFDKYPYQFYTFSVSVLAILMSSVILLAGNRQAEVDRAHAENAYHHVDEVNTKQDQQLKILSEQAATALRQHHEILERLSILMAERRLPVPGDSSEQPSAG